MHYVVDTGTLVREGVLTEGQTQIIKSRSREVMVNLAINTVLCGAIIAAGLGFVFWLADAALVAIAGTLFLAIGAAILIRGAQLYRMFGTAASLIGALMLVAGASVKVDQVFDWTVAGPILIAAGLAVAGLSHLAKRHGPQQTGFVTGSILVMGVAMHLFGLGVFLDGVDGVPVMLAWGYAAGVIALTGWLVDVRLVTALAIVPFAQMLDAGTFYFHASYFFYSRESTLSILQMAALIGLCLWGAKRFDERSARHFGIVAIMALVVGNLCFLVGSLWGDAVGESYFRDAYFDVHGYNYEAYRTARAAFRAKTLVISEGVYSIAYALVLAAAAFWSAHRVNRGPFNTVMVFAAIHAYSQGFESFGDEPLAYVIGGLAAVPLAWGMWRMDARFRKTA